MRSIKRLVQAVVTKEGDGIIVTRPFPTPTLSDIDPFLLIDEFGPTTYGPGETKGVSDHPHRGFETVTIMLSGEFMHKDSRGGTGTLKPGDVQWMTAGCGVVHSEMPSDAMRKSGGVLHGFQLWVNLPKSKKFIEPRYQQIVASAIPTLTPAAGVTVRLIAGEMAGKKGAATTHTPIMLLHVTLAPMATWTFDTQRSWTQLVYVSSGTMSVQGTRGQRGSLFELADDHSSITLQNDSAAEPSVALVLAGEPIGEPIARMGPFVMNTKSELMEAYDDYMNGRMGGIQ